MTAARERGQKRKHDAHHVTVYMLKSLPAETMSSLTAEILLHSSRANVHLGLRGRGRVGVSEEEHEQA